MNFIFGYLGMALIAILFLIAFVVVWQKRGTISGLRNWALLIPTGAWALATVWDWSVVTFSSEANIRVDLLCIVPLTIILSIVGIVLTVRK